ncbi:GNAT family N-acetyltransferase [Pedobacter sp. SYP-B3415]|uniref:GNAT family N-acetyltransferase n=1 Tax=Pedobacter sp. SYP-B3415 TaxID=2496641 RepID=UPI00101C86E2|nr:GNAT family N-acetyltransferase [Pedobacter sp. SYP-B3415]
MSAFQPALNLQLPLQNELVALKPLQEEDFEALYRVASDPLIWEQHPNKNRYQKEIFRNFFNGAMESGGAYLILDRQTNEIAGSTRMYDLDTEQAKICIGYTFLARKFWGKGHNSAAKALLLSHAFGYVAEVHFHVGAENLRSQIAISRIGAKKIAEMEVAYYGEPSRLNFIYRIRRDEWQQRNEKM